MTLELSRIARARLPFALLRLLLRLRGRRSTVDRVWLTKALGVGRSGNVIVRPLDRGDASAWTLAMRANAARMERWWSSAEGNLEELTDRTAFLGHLGSWDARLRQGTGACLALVGPAGLFGELHIWHLTPGGLTCEIGLWMKPGDPALTRGAGGCLGYVVDRLIQDLGIRRVEAPVAVGNTMPRALLRLGGFEIEATIPRWREVRGELVDYDLFALTPERWRAARERGRDLLGDWGYERPIA